MLPLLLLALPLPILAAVDKTHGVPPELLSKYSPNTATAVATWKCLNSSKEIPWSAVNDDYCDCPDGSDEPGTGACPHTLFYCRNEGHVGSYITSSRVNDGLCEPDCCDGSDEALGVCANTCKEIGAAYRAKQDAERKLRKTGSKIRSTYIAFARKEKKRLEDLIASSETEIAAKHKEVDRLQDIVDRAESLSAAALEHKKQSPLYQSLVKQHNALKSLQKEYKKHLEREKSLGDILDTLRTGYNPNYQDMAVLEAVRGWEHFAGLPHINDVRKDDASAEDLVVSKVDSEEKLEEGFLSAEELEKEIPSLLNTNYESLLIEHESHVGISTEESNLLNLSAYLPDALIPQYETLRTGLVSWLGTLGIIKPIVGAAADTSRAQEVLKDAKKTLKSVEQEKIKAGEDLGHLFDPKWFGSEGEWKKLEGTCLEKNTGDYTYEFCFFGEAKQKPNNGGSTFSLGNFESWNDRAGAEVGSSEYYSKQSYTRGTKCWNGPQRSVQVLLTCGTENALLTVQELEKCEYQFTATSPALCLPLDSSEEKRDEL